MDSDTKYPTVESIEKEFDLLGANTLKRGLHSFGAKVHGARSKTSEFFEDKNIADYNAYVQSIIIWACIIIYWLTPRAIRDSGIILIGIAVATLSMFVMMLISRVGGWAVTQQVVPIAPTVYYKGLGVKSQRKVWKFFNFVTAIERLIPAPLEGDAMGEMQRLHGDKHNSVIETVDKYTTQIQSDNGYVNWKLFFKYPQWCPITETKISSVIMKTHKEFVGVESLLFPSDTTEVWVMRGFSAHVKPFVGDLRCDGQTYGPTGEPVLYSSTTLEENPVDGISRDDMTVIDETYARKMTNELRRAVAMYRGKKDEAQVIAGKAMIGFGLGAKTGQPGTQTTQEKPTGPKKTDWRYILGAFVVIGIILALIFLTGGVRVA